MAVKFLDPVALSRIGTLALKARTVVEGALSGLHRSPHHGSSVEFAEHKEYSPGDEIKHIDWKAFGKFDRYYVKRFEEETELTCYLLLDRSGSMEYRGGGISKLEYAAYLCAALAYVLNRQQDRVGLMAFASSQAYYVPPRQRSNHLHDLLRALETVVGEGGRGDTQISAALERTSELARRRRSLVLLVSDLFDPSPEVMPLLRRLRAQRHDVSVIQTLDPDELELPFEGVTLFESLEDDRRLLADPRAIRTAYLRELQTFLDRVRRELAEGDVEHLLIPTSQPLERTLLDFLTGRARRRIRLSRAV
jgi:uncharacterized protein (DUF58 family)